MEYNANNVCSICGAVGAFECGEDDMCIRCIKKEYQVKDRYRDREINDMLEEF